MTRLNQIAWDDTVLPFQLDRSDLRGRVVRLDGVLDHILSRHDYPAPVAAALAEVCLLTALIGPMVKLRWKLSLQVRGSGAIRTLAADYYAPEGEGASARMRAWASFDPARLDPAAPAFPQIGPDGYVALLIDQGAGNLPYQGITPLAGASIANCAQTYFAQSEQIPTRFALAFGVSEGLAQGWRAGGVMLQTLPATPMTGEGGGSGEGGLIAAADILQGAQSEDWNRANLLLDTVETLELVGPAVDPTDLLIRLFHEEQPRVFDPQRIEFGCSCSADRVRGTLAIYSAKDIARMTTPEGTVTADCQFCGAHYAFDPRQLGFEATLDGDGNPLTGTAE